MNTLEIVATSSRTKKRRYNMGLTGSRVWVRANGGWIAGVCEGIGRGAGISPGLLRLVVVLAALCGVGLILYPLAIFSLPREGEKRGPKFLGVCDRLSDVMNIEVGLIRLLMLFIGIGSVGVTFIGYLILHFVMPQDEGRL